MNILSIQSHVAYGHVGNAAAVFPLQRLGIEVWPIHTVQFSNHTGYGQWRGQVFDASLIGELVEGLEERGVLGECDGVLSGYMGSAAIGEAIVEAVARTKAANPAARYCCDPVIGDVGRGIFVRPGVAEYLRDHAVPVADVMTPNHFELAYLTERTITTRPDATAAAQAIQARGPRVVLTTSLRTEETPAGSLEILVSDREQHRLLRTPELPVTINGAGDMIAALFLAHFIRSGDAFEAASCAVSSTYGILRRTAEAGSREILLIAAQEELIEPSERFEPIRI